MIELPVKASIIPIEERLAGVTGGMVDDHANRWVVEYQEPNRVRDFLQARGLRNQDIDREPLARALLAGLLPDIFGKVFENGARPKSGYPCHDGEIIDTSRGDVVIAYTYVQFWDHYKTDPIKDGLNGCGFSVKIESADTSLLPVDSISREQMFKIIFGGKLEQVLEARPEFKGFDHLWQKSVFSYGNRFEEDGFTRASLVMHPLSPIYEDINNAVELYRAVTSVIQGAQDKFRDFADLSDQTGVAEGLLGKVRGASKAFSSAFKGTGEGAEYERHLAEAGNFVESKRESLREYVASRKQKVLTDLTANFELLRDRLVTYFTQPLFTTEIN